MARLIHRRRDPFWLLLILSAGAGSGGMAVIRALVPSDPQAGIAIVFLSPLVAVPGALVLPWFDQRPWRLYLYCLAAAAAVRLMGAQGIARRAADRGVDRPLGGIVAAISLAFSRLAYRLEFKPTPDGECPSCGYCLTGLPETRCPECGADFSAARRRESNYPEERK